MGRHPLGTLGGMTSLGGSWRLVEIDGKPVDPDAPNEIRFDDGRISGRIGVNRFNGSYIVSADTIEFGPAATTRMAGPPELMDLEDRFLAALQGEHPVRIETRLVVGDLVLILRPEGEADS
jgi:heat shock protein HslJ